MIAFTPAATRKATLTHHVGLLKCCAGSEITKIRPVVKLMANSHRPRHEVATTAMGTFLHHAHQPQIEHASHAQDSADPQVKARRKATAALPDDRQ
jgi:hypothetical protein